MGLAPTAIPENPDWDGNVASWTESAGTSSSLQCQRNVEAQCFFLKFEAENFSR